MQATLHANPSAPMPSHLFTPPRIRFSILVFPASCPPPPPPFPDAYNEQVERQGTGVMLTEGQREWVKAQLHLLHDLPEKRSRAPAARWRRRVHAVVAVSR